MSLENNVRCINIPYYAKTTLYIANRRQLRTIFAVEAAVLVNKKEQITILPTRGQDSKTGEEESQGRGIDKLQKRAPSELDVAMLKKATMKAHTAKKIVRY